MRRAVRQPSRSGEPVPSFDLRLMDREMQKARQALAGHEFSTVEEANAFLQGLLCEHGGRLPDTPAETPQDRARDKVHEAFGASGRRRLALAREALALDPDCADAHVLLAEEANSPEEALDLYRAAFEAAERTLGAEFFADPSTAGHFWGIVETRPYMRAGSGLGSALWATGAHDQAISLYQKLLTLNPGDNQGLRYNLFGWLIVAGRDKEAEQVSKRFLDDEMASMEYLRALLAFRRYGDSARSRKALRKAYDSNRWLPLFLLGLREPVDDPGYYEMGSEEEAVAALMSCVEPLVATPKAQEWFAQAIVELALVTNAEEWSPEG